MAVYSYGLMSEIPILHLYLALICGLLVHPVLYTYPNLPGCNAIGGTNLVYLNFAFLALYDTGQC